jgi:hypothetical protein
MHADLADCFVVLCTCVDACAGFLIISSLTYLLVSCIKTEGKEGGRCPGEDLLRIQHCCKILAYGIAAYLQMEVILYSFVGQPGVSIKDVVFQKTLLYTIPFFVNSDNCTFFFFLLLTRFLCLAD